MEKIEVKLDRTTLPEDGQWVEFDTYEQSELVGYFIESENMFHHPDGNFRFAWDVHAWSPLKIKWSWKEWTERNEGLAILEGFDRFGNEFTAGGEISLGEIVKVEDIEFVNHKDIK